MKMKFLLMAFFVSTLINSPTIQAEDDQSYDSIESSDDIYLPSEDILSEQEPILLDESDSQSVEGASEYDY